MSTPHDPQRGGRGADEGQQGRPGQYPGQPQPAGYPYNSPAGGQPQYPAAPGYPAQPQGQPPYGQPYPGQPGQPAYPGRPAEQGNPAQPGYPAQRGYPAPPGQPGYPAPPGYPAQQAYPGTPAAGYPGEPAPPPRPPQPGLDGFGQYPYPYTGGFASVARPSSERMRRPGIMHLSLGVLILSTLPVLAVSGIGLVGLLRATQSDSIKSAVDAIAKTFSTSADQAVGIARIITGGFIALALIYILLAILAWQGKNWARIVVTVLTVVFDAVLLLGVFSGGVDTVTLAAVIVVAVLSVLGVALLYLPPSAAYYRAQAES